MGHNETTARDREEYARILKKIVADLKHNIALAHQAERYELEDKLTDALKSAVKQLQAYGCCEQSD